MPPCAHACTIGMPKVIQYSVTAGTIAVGLLFPSPLINWHGLMWENKAIFVCRSSQCVLKVVTYPLLI